MSGQQRRSRCSSDGSHASDRALKRRARHAPHAWRAAALFAALLSIGAACSHSVEVQAKDAPTRKENGSRVFDHSGLDKVLGRFVTETGMVRYEKLVQDRADLDDYVAGLAAASPQSRSELFPTRAHEIAYWVNAYNALMLRAVVDAYPVESVEDIMAAHGVFSRLYFTVGGKSMTLDDIEKGVLLRQYDEPRVHFALTCASMSCPRIDQRTFRAARLAERLDEEGRAFLNSPTGLRIHPEENRIELSRYFEWYREDFQPHPLAFVRPYLEEEKRERLDSLDEPEIDFMDYDWRLNDADAPWAPR